MTEHDERPQWPVAPHDQLLKEVLEWDESVREERVRRLAFVLGEFGPPADMLLLGGPPAMLSIRELQHAFITGNFLSTILLAQVFVEHTLAGPYRLAGKDPIVEAGLKRLIDESVKDEYVGPVIGARLHELREMRNPYTHPHAGMSPRSYMARLMARGPEPFEMVEADAAEAIRIVIDFLREGSPGWAPPKDAA
jgi:hypothetical protein